MTEALSSASSMSGIMDDIEIKKVRHPRNQLRADEYNVSELASSIREKGLLQPIIVRPYEDYFEIVAGNRRYEACKSIGWRKITSHIVELDDKEAFETALVENIQRRTLNPVEEARAFKAYILNFGWGGATQLSLKLGKSVSYVTKRIASLELPVDVVTSLNNSTLSSSIGEELCSVKDDRKKSELAQLIAERHLSLRKVRELIECENDITKANPYYQNTIQDEQLELQKSIEKCILIMRMAMNRLGIVIEGINEDCWPVREILLHHRNMLHGQIDILLKEKKKCNYSLIKLMK
jgi:ParB family transcriptional regulator, chromosome partitioning protein